MHILQCGFHIEVVDIDRKRQLSTSPIFATQHLFGTNLKRKHMFVVKSTIFQILEMSIFAYFFGVTWFLI